MHLFRLTARTARVQLISSLACAALMVSACDRSETDPVTASTHPVSVALVLSSNSVMTSAGDTCSVSAVVRNAGNVVIASPALLWTTSAPGVAAITTAGNSAIVTAVEDGEAVITVSSGTAVASAIVRVHRQLASIAITNTDSVLNVATQVPLSVVGLDARGHVINSVTGIAYQSSNRFDVIVSPTGIMTALYSSFIPHISTVSATVVQNGVTLRSEKRFRVASSAPAAFEFSSLMFSGGLLSDTAIAPGDAVMYLTLDGDVVRYRMFWSYLSDAPVSAHIHLVDNDVRVGTALVDLPLGVQQGAHGAASGTFSAHDIRGLGNNPIAARDSLIKLMSTFAAFVDLHTPLYTDGELGGLVYGQPPRPLSCITTPLERYGANPRPQSAATTSTLMRSPSTCTTTK